MIAALGKRNENPDQSGGFGVPAGAESARRRGAPAAFPNRGAARCVKTPWQRPIFPHPRECSIVGAETFHFRVRDGNGWVRLAQTTKGLRK